MAMLPFFRFIVFIATTIMAHTAGSFQAATAQFQANQYVVNVDEFGAKADKKTDDSQAFLEAWEKACSTKGSIFLVPAKKEYYLKPVIFQGPCQSGNIAKIQGHLIASTNLTDYEQDRRVWIKFANLTDFSVDGGGVFHGNGHIWWPFNCHVNISRPCIGAATSLTFENCTNLKVSHLSLRNAQQQHMSFNSCVSVEASYIKVKTRRTSPNTDAIHFTKSSFVTLKNCDLKTGDDCISIVGGSHDIRAIDITCGQGAHGISIGSLGRNGSEEFVSNITVIRARIKGTTNGLRIKTWQGGHGFVRNITFEDVKMHNVTKPIIINQFYCEKDFLNPPDCSVKKDAVLVDNVLYKNIRGTSAIENGIIFNCSATVPCENIKVEDVRLGFKGNSSILASCSNANVQEIGENTPQCPK